MLKSSDYFILAAALLSGLASVLLFFSGYKEYGIFVGLWVPSLLGFGIYFKTLYNKE